MLPNFSSTAFRVEKQLSHTPKIPTRIGRAEGGLIPDAPHLPFSGPIKSAVPGRTDHVPMHVLSNSYVIPADIVSAIGEGNSDAGHKLLDHMFAVPDRMKAAPYEATHFAAGGLAGQGTTPIMAAGGEYVVHPAAVAKIGGGDVKHGHKVLDKFVKNMRAKTISTLKKLPGPAK